MIKTHPGGLGSAGLGFQGLGGIFQPKWFCDSKLHLLGTKSFPWLQGQLNKFADEVRVGPAVQESLHIKQSHFWRAAGGELCSRFLLLAIDCSGNEAELERGPQGIPHSPG